MDPYILHTLPEIENLIPPHGVRDLRRLEASLLAEGCKSPIAVWNGIILDGHARYKICQKHNIPILVQKYIFQDLNHALSWVCSHQIKHRKLSPEMKKYLIGKHYECERAFRARKVTDARGRTCSLENTSVITKRLVAEYGVCSSSIKKYGYYARNMDIICSKVSGSVTTYLSGNYDIPLSSAETLACMPPKELTRELKKRKKTRTSKPPQMLKLQDTSCTPVKQPQPLPEIKNMPKFDPDAEITGLILTIPSWISSLDRIIHKTDLTIITPQARARSENTLIQLQEKITELSLALKEA